MYIIVQEFQFLWTLSSIDPIRLKKIKIKKSNQNCRKTRIGVYWKGRCLLIYKYK